MRLVNETVQLRLLIAKFLGEQGEEYCKLYRYAPERITGDCRAWLTVSGVSTQYTDKTIYGHIEARLTYVFDLAAEYKLTKQRLGLTDDDLARFFGYGRRLSYFMSSRKNQHITAFLHIARAAMP